MDKYQLIALDMDGTLLNSELKITPRTLDAIRRVAQAGRHVVLSTGRCLSEMRDLLRDLPDIRYIVCENGGCVYDRKYDHTLHVDPVPEAEVRHILGLMEKERVVIQVFSDNQSYVNQPDHHWMDGFRMQRYKASFDRSSVWDPKLFDRYHERPFRIEKINLYFDTDNARRRIHSVLSQRPLKLVISLAYLLECVSEHADKGRGLQMLCRNLDIPMERTIAVGDSMNDIEMLSAAGFSVAMGNACAEAKAAAHAVTDDCDHDGVARVIDEYLL